MMKLTALDALQSGLENVQRVIDVHGDCEVGGDDEPIYDLEIAADYLREAERLLEGACQVLIGTRRIGNAAGMVVRKNHCCGIVL